MDSIEKYAIFSGHSYDKNDQGAAHSANVTMITGTAMSDSADGVVSVDFGGNTISSDDEQAVDVSTTCAVKEGDTVQVSVVGADGTAKSLLVTGVIAGGDRMESEIGAATDTANQASQTAMTANESATKANELANTANEQANTAIKNADQANEYAQAAKTAAASAETNASKAMSDVETANGKIATLQENVNTMNSDISTAQDAISKNASDITGINQKLSTDYATKGEVSDVKAAVESDIETKANEITASVAETYAAKSDVTEIAGKLENRISVNENGISTSSEKITTLESKTEDISKNVTAAQSAADAAQTDATSALTNASKAQTTADTAVSNANAAQIAASNAQTAADKAQSTVDNIQVGGRNLLLNSEKTIETTQDGLGNLFEYGLSNAFTTLKKGDYVTLTVQVDIENAVAFSRAGAEIGISFPNGNPNQWFASWVLCKNLTPQNGVYNFHGRVKSKNTLKGDITDLNQVIQHGMYIQSRESIKFADGGYIRVSNPKLEIGNRATDWTPAPEDVESSIDAAQSTADTAVSNANAAQTAASNAQTAADKAQSTANGAITAAATALSNGKMLYTDPYFANGTNGTHVYNNINNKNVKIERVAKSSDNPFINTSYELKITNIGESNPGCGGFSFGNQSRANAKFIYRIVAKIPSGKPLQFGTNSTGGGKSKWLTPRNGTGEFTEYVVELDCGASGTFSTTGFFYLDADHGTPSNPVEWRVAYATCFDMTNVSDALNAKNKADSAKTAADKAKSAADKAQSTADSAKTSSDTNARDLANYITKNTSTLEQMQSLIDGSIMTWFFPCPPADTNEPTSKWTTTDLKNQHLGDLYYDTDTGYCYRYQVEHQVYSWQRITDVDVTKALADAKNAQDTADGKRRVFVAQPTPPYDVGDLWTAGANGDIKRCRIAKTSEQSYAASDWELASKYTDDTTAKKAQDTANGASTAAATAQSAADGAKTAANNAQTAANSAKTAADKAKTAADKANSDLAKLTDTVTTQGTQINQNSDSITSVANRTTTVENKFTNYYTKTETNSQIKQTADGINSTVSKKVGKDEVISSINQSAEEVKINANRVAINGTLSVTDAINNAQTAASDASKAAQNANAAADAAANAAQSAQQTANATKTYFYNDASGSHVISQNSTSAGTRTDVKADGMHIVDQDDGKELASFTSSGAAIGKDSEIHTKYSADGVSYYKASENYPFMEIEPRTYQGENGTGVDFRTTADYDSTNPGVYFGQSTISMDAGSDTTSESSTGTSEIQIAAYANNAELTDPRNAYIDVFASNYNQNKASGDGDDVLASTYINMVADEVYINNIPLHPVGSIYMSVNSTSPASLFGGTWEQIKDVFLLAAGSTYAAGTTGGEKEHKLTLHEMPGEVVATLKLNSIGSGISENPRSWVSIKNKSFYSATLRDFISLSDYGSGTDAAHNNMPPYLSVYVWRRIA